MRNERKAVRLEQVLQLIRAQIAATGGAPTIAEIGARLHLTNGYVHELLVLLEEKGLIVRLPNISRGIALADRPNGSTGKFSVDGFEPADDDSDPHELLGTAGAGASTASPYIDAFTARAINAYEKDWHESMSTWLQLQREYMG
jgi:SOS-response transcriptional repressor LexA